jgi:hypothetical protein
MERNVETITSTIASTLDGMHGNAYCIGQYMNLPPQTYMIPKG